MPLLLSKWPAGLLPNVAKTFFFLYKSRCDSSFLIFFCFTLYFRLHFFLHFKLILEHTRRSFMFCSIYFVLATLTKYRQINILLALFRPKEFWWNEHELLPNVYSHSHSIYNRIGCMASGQFHFSSMLNHVKPTIHKKQNGRKVMKRNYYLK